jgi:peptide/nickel transport system substrate-binding protein
MKRKISLLLCLSLLLAVFFTACGKSDDNSPEAKAGYPKRDGMEDTLIVGTHETKGEFMPAYYGTTYDGYVNQLIFDQLLANNEKGELIPSVAKDWKVSDDKKTYTFHLRDDVKFTDGTPLTAKDVEFTYLTIADPNYDGRYITMVSDIKGYKEYHEDKNGKVKSISGIKVEDKYTISFTFNEAMVTNIYNCQMLIMPKHYYGFEKGDIPKLKTLMQKPLGSGKYIFVKYEPKQYIEFKANPDYFGGAPKIPKLIMKFTTSETMLQELEKGGVDIQLEVPPSPENKEIIDDTKFLSICDFPGNNYGYMGFNLRDPRLADKNVRKALVYGFDRKAFADLYYKGYADVCNQPISEASWAYSDDVEKYEYDVDKANKLLDEAGWKVGSDGIREKDGKKLSFVWDTYTDSKYVETLIPMLKDNWQKIGVKVEPNLMDFNALADKVYTQRKFDMYNMSWTLTLDPDAYDLFHSDADIPDGNNSVGFRNAENDKLIMEERKEFDPEKRKVIIKEWADLIGDELPYMFLTQNTNWDIYSERVKNYKTSPFVDWTYIVNQLELEK